MGTKSKQPHQKRLSDQQVSRMDRMTDLKIMQVSQQFAQTLSVLSAKVEVLEKIALENGETTESLQERFFDRLDEMNGITKSTEGLTAGDRVRISFKQAITEAELSTAPSESTMLIMGQSQVHENLDKALMGLKQGEMFSVTLPPLQDGGPSVLIEGIVKAVYSMKQGATDAKKTAEQATSSQDQVS